MTEKKSEPVPYVAFSNESIKGLPDVKAGDVFMCHRCKTQHTLYAGKNTKGEEVPQILLYRCGEKTYLGGVGGKLAVNKKTDSSGVI